MSAVQSVTRNPPLVCCIPWSRRWFRAMASHYTSAMTLLALTVALLAQITPDADGLQPYILHFNGDEGSVRVLADPSLVNGISFRALYDEPWTRVERWERIQRSTLKPDGIEREESALREAWLNAEWPKHGGVQVETRSGRRVWVLDDEKSWADKAQSMARAAYASPAVAAANPELPNAESTAGPGAVQLWAPHVAVIAGAIALGAAVFLLLIRKREVWQPLNPGNPAPRRR
jgi:hypothetical protein